MLNQPILRLLTNCLISRQDLASRVNPRNIQTYGQQKLPRPHAGTWCLLMIPGQLIGLCKGLNMQISSSAITKIMILKEHLAEMAL